jgi:hypothetical protein
MRVFRVEHPATGCGPYNFAARRIHTSNPEIEQHLEEIINVSSHHPDPSEEPKLYKVWVPFSDWLCGFNSFKQYAEWFLTSRLALHNLGFQLLEHEIPEAYVKQGDYQVLFKKKDIVSTTIHSCLSSQNV